MTDTKLSLSLPASESPSSPIDPQSFEPEENAEPQTTPLPERHSRKCQICRHPHRAWIEFAFVNWQSARVIALDYDLTDNMVVYRHAHVANLFAQRRLKVISFFEHIMENAYYTQLNSSAVMAAAQGFLKLVNSKPADPTGEPNPRTVRQLNQSLN